MSQHPAPAATAQVRILGNQYLVVLDGRSHVVGKDKRCHTCHDECTAVTAVARYLKAGGPRAPDRAPAPPGTSMPDPAPDPLPPCPICGAAVTADHVLDHLTHGPGWRCTEGGYAHLFLHRYAHLKTWFCGEGARRHAMFLPDEPAGTKNQPPDILPFAPHTSPTSDTSHQKAA